MVVIGRHQYHGVVHGVIMKRLKPDRPLDPRASPEMMSAADEVIEATVQFAAQLMELGIKHRSPPHFVLVAAATSIVALMRDGGIMPQKDALEQIAKLLGGIRFENTNMPGELQSKWISSS
jgi:hypothetical protein